MFLSREKNSILPSFAKKLFTFKYGDILAKMAEMSLIFHSQVIPLEFHQDLSSDKTGVSGYHPALTACWLVQPCWYNTQEPDRWTDRRTPQATSYNTLCLHGAYASCGKKRSMIQMRWRILTAFLRSISSCLRRSSSSLRLLASISCFLIAPKQTNHMFTTWFVRWS